MFVKKDTSRSFGTPRIFFYLGLLTIGQTVFRPFLSFTVSDWFFLISFFFTISESLLSRNIDIRFPAFMIFGMFLFTIGGVLSSIFAKMPFISFIALIKYLYLIVIWFWLGTVLLKKPDQIRTAIVLWTSSAALSGLSALVQLIWNDIIPGTTPILSRMAGLTEHVNELGGLTSIALIPAIMMLTRSSNNIFYFVNSWICTVLIVGGLVLSVSMSGVLALIASLSVWILLSRYSHRKIIIIVIACVLFFTAISIQSRYEGVSILSRFYEISNDGFALYTLQTRLDTYSAAWEIISNNPLLGVGLGPDVGLTETGYVVHNFLLLNWFQSGLFGLMGILMILGAIALEGYKGIKDPRRKNQRMLGIALFSSYIAFIVLGIAQPIYYNRFGWISAVLLLALNSRRHRFDDWTRPYIASDQFVKMSLKH